MAEFRNRNPGANGGFSKLENWRMIDWHGLPVAEGEVYNDLRWEDGTYIYTSAITKVADDRKTIQTRNTIYELGAPKAKE